MVIENDAEGKPHNASGKRIAPSATVFTDKHKGYARLRYRCLIADNGKSVTSVTLV